MEALGKVFSLCRSALLKHEVAYVLGQLQVGICPMHPVVRGSLCTWSTMLWRSDILSQSIMPASFSCCAQDPSTAAVLTAVLKDSKEHAM